MKYSLLLLLLLMSFQCSTKREILKDINNPKLEIDTSIKKQPLKLIERVHIEETPYLILANINDVQFNPDTTQILITDPANRTANLYDYKTGKIINWLRASIDLADSIAYCKWKGPIKSPFFQNEEDKYIKSKNYNKFKITDKEIEFYIKNRFFNAKFINNNIYLSTLAYVFASTTEINKKFSVYPLSLIVICSNQLKMKKTIIFETIPDDWPSPHDFFYDKKTTKYFIPSNGSIKESYYHIYDSLPAISEYSQNGDFIKYSSFVPKIFTSNKIRKGLYIGVSFTFIKNNIYLSTPFDLSIYKFERENLFDKKLFDLKNLPISNDSGFTYYHDISLKFHDKRYAMTGQESYKFMTSYFPIRIVRAFKVKNNIGIHLVVYDSTQKSGYYYILQEYTTKGKLLSQTNIYDDPDNRIKYITFDNKNNYLVIFKKSKKGWIMEKRQWL